MPFVADCFATNASMRFVCCFNSLYLCLYVSGNRFLDGGVSDRRESLHDDRAVILTKLLPFWWRELKGRGVDFMAYKTRLTVNISKTVSRSVTCQLEHNMLSDRRNLSKV